MTDRKDRNFPYSGFLVLIGFLAGVLAFILCSRRQTNRGVQAPQPAPGAEGSPERAILLPDEMPGGGLPPAEDLTLIEGIGPKVAAVLNAAGILRLEQLARLTPAELKNMLLAAGNRISNPATWPEQAALAAAGKWDELKALQASLTGGRRV